MTAIWTLPRTWATGDLVIADMLNEQIRNNLEALKTPPGGSVVGTTDISTTSTTMVNMTDMGVTLTLAGTQCLVAFSAPILADTARTLTLGIGVDGSTVVSDANKCDVNTNPKNLAFMIRLTGLTAGSRTVNVRWMTSAGTVFQAGSTDAARRMLVSEVT